MEIITIHGANYTAKINSLGAELKSVKSADGTEFMWQADADIWPRTAPVLFPVVGKVKNDLLRVNEVTYPISQHGFARDKKFNVVEQTASSVELQLIYDDETLKKYPFDFKLTLSYTWVEDELVCGYEVENVGPSDLFFSIGAHPGFNIPEGHFENYFLEFEKSEKLVRHLLNDGLFNHETEQVLTENKILPLGVELFDKDAIVFKDLRSTWIALKNTITPYSVKMGFKGFPDFGIWSKKGTQRFLCLEPWFGHADYEEGHRDISNKEGIQVLAPHHKFEASYRLSFTS